MTLPLVARSRAALDDALDAGRRQGDRLGLVPTMGALHAGHVALLSEGRRLVGPDGTLVASIFVNPLQFGPSEDLARYPRPFDADLERCAGAGVDVVFAPSVAEVYPGGDPVVTVDPGSAGTLEGAVRPGHFRGVATVVTKLFGMVRPDIAVFGEKDYEQLVLVRRTALDLCLRVDVVGVETVRDPDGLALSSRNAYLSEADRSAALALSRALRAGATAGGQGGDAVLSAAGAVLAAEPSVDVDYLTLTGPDLGEPPGSGPARLLVAARVGTTRLIDNIAVVLR